MFNNFELFILLFYSLYIATIMAVPNIIDFKINFFLSLHTL